MPWITILVAGLADASRPYGIAMIVLAFIGLIATIMLLAAEPAPGTGALSPSAACCPGELVQSSGKRACDLGHARRATSRSE
jgi:hypothetical protein